MTYNETVNSKKNVLATNEVKKGIMSDTNLDKPAGKVKKLIKKIMD